MIPLKNNYFVSKVYAEKKLKTFISTYNNILRYGFSGSYLPDIIKLNIENGKPLGLIFEGDREIIPNSMVTCIEPISGFW